MEKIKTIFDCDPGVDDAFAIAFLKKSNAFDVKLVSSVAGNVELKHTTRNLRGLVKALDWDVEVAQGAEKPLMNRQFLASDVHGNNGLSGYEFRDDELAPLSERSAYDAMVDILESSPEKILIIAVGPLTNIALLLLGRPDLKEKISEITIMGGGLKGGNITPAAEFNIYADPEAAHIVFKSGIKINMAGLDITEKAIYTDEEQDKIRQSDSKINKILSQIIDSQLNKKRLEKGDTNCLNDVVAVMYHTNPEVFSGENYHVEIEVDGRICRGMTLADRKKYRRQEGNTFCMLDLDLEKYNEALLEVLLRD